MGHLTNVNLCMIERKLQGYFITWAAVDEHSLEGPVWIGHLWCLGYKILNSYCISTQHRHSLRFYFYFGFSYTSKKTLQKWMRYSSTLRTSQFGWLRGGLRKWCLKSVHAQSLQSCLTLCNPLDYGLLGSSVHGILQARILEWVTLPSSKWSSQPRDWTCISGIAGGSFYSLSQLGNPQWHRRKTEFYSQLCDYWPCNHEQIS